MPCFNPDGYPCGKCSGCQSSKASEWSVRLFHEQQQHPQSSFVTLTYELDPVDVSKPDAQLFLKRLRRSLEPKRIRFFLAAEYGEKSHRPHYHAIIFGHDFSLDPGAHQIKSQLYASPRLTDTWGLGHASSGSVTAASIRYVANYLLGQQQQPEVLDLETGTARPAARTFALMSRNPGLGASWIDEHSAETYRLDKVRVDGFERRPPRYYDKRIQGEKNIDLRLARRNARVSHVLRSPRTYLDNIDSGRRSAAAKIHSARRSMTQGEL